MVNVGASGYASFVVPTEFNAYRSSVAGALAAIYYVLPLVAVALLHDHFDGAESPATTWRAAWVKVCVIEVSAAVWYASAVLLSYGVHAMAGHAAGPGDLIMRPLTGLAGVALFGLAEAELFVCVAFALRSATRSLIACMIAFLLTGIGLSLLSDLLLVQQLGPQPVAGTREWAEYLRSLTTAPGILVYVFSPSETYLSVLGGAVGEVNLDPARVASVLAIVASPSLALLPFCAGLVAWGIRHPAARPPRDDAAQAATS